MQQAESSYFEWANHSFIEHEGENIEIPIQVTPEFPLGVLVVIAISCLIDRH
ncbi:MAG: hypothetical protein HMLIMOIP_002218 [Candidatus Nitrosomirales archaeon]